MKRVLRSVVAAAAAAFLALGVVSCGTSSSSSGASGPTTVNYKCGGCGKTSPPLSASSPAPSCCGKPMVKQ